MWGWGQRDQHTIPSEFARLSEQEGVPVHVTNFGQLAYVHWQEVLLFERALAHRPPPDLVVFYDGVNDVLAQQGIDSNPSDNPTIYDFGNFPPAAVPGAFGADPVAPRSSWLETWADNSVIARAARNLRNVLAAQPAGAATLESSPPRDVVISRTTDIYERGRALADDLAGSHDIEPAFFWQPHRHTAVDDLTGFLWEPDRPAPPHTIDLGDVLSGEDPDAIFSDQAHTNELGAQLVAASMWSHLQDDVRTIAASPGTGSP